MICSDAYHMVCLVSVSSPGAISLSSSRGLVTRVVIFVASIYTPSCFMISAVITWSFAIHVASVLQKSPSNRPSSFSNQARIYTLKRKKQRPKMPRMIVIEHVAIQQHFFLFCDLNFSIFYSIS